MPTTAFRSPTRERILQASLPLFNEDGLARTSTHGIAAEVQISNGNLNYHFKTKGAIVALLVARFEDSLAPAIEAAASAAALDDLWLSLQLLFESVDCYRFTASSTATWSRRWPNAPPANRACRH